jgi:hypothetical protein
MADTSIASPLSQPDDPHAEYRTIEPWAVGGVLLGLLSAVAMLGGVLWLVAALGIVANLVALARIRNDRHRDGRGAALLGLGLSIAFAIAPMAQTASSRWLLSRQARPVAEMFLQFLCENGPEKAMDLRIAPDQRIPLDDQLWANFRHNPEARDLLKKFVQDPVVRTLMALGTQADVRFFKTSTVVTDGSRGVVSQYFTVTYPDDDEGKQTFFVNVMLERNTTEEPGINPWRVIDLDGGFDPNDPAVRDTEDRGA